MTKCIVVKENLDVVEMNIETDEIPYMFDSGYFSAVLKMIGNALVYADVDMETCKFIGWKEVVMEDAA